MKSIQASLHCHGRLDAFFQSNVRVSWWSMLVATITDMQVFQRAHRMLHRCWSAAVCEKQTPGSRWSHDLHIKKRFRNLSLLGFLLKSFVFVVIYFYLFEDICSFI